MHFLSPYYSDVMHWRENGVKGHLQMTRRHKEASATEKEKTNYL